MNSIFESNTYLIQDEQSNQCCLVDCGDSWPIIKELQRRDLELTAIFITHSHFDHIYGLNEITSYAPFVKVYLSSYGKDGLFSDRLNMSRYHSTSFVYKCEKNVKVLCDKQQMFLFGENSAPMKIYETPGHDWSACCYQIGNHLFTGDSYLPQHKIVTNFPKSDKEKARRSLEFILKLAAGCNLYPGHGDIVYV